MTNARSECQREHDFALVLSGIADLTPEIEDKLFEAGCGDATLSIRGGKVYARFSRTAATMKDAILSAIRDVWKARVGADILRVDDCNLVTQAEIARKIDRSRQFVRQLITGERGPGGFPGPACHICDDSPLWYWCEVAHWLWNNNMIKEELVRDAQESWLINSVLEWKHQTRVNAELAEEIIQSIDASMVAYAGN